MIKEKVVIYFAGGTMSGVFGAGVAQAFQEKDIYSEIEAIYAGSAGAMTGAYFLARQVPLGSSIYWDNLTKSFVSIKGFWLGVWQRFQNKFLFSVHKDKLWDALDVKYLMNIVKNEKTLDIERIKSQSIPFYVKLFNIDTHKIEYLEVKSTNIFNILEAGVTVFPYVHEVSLIENSRYIDGAVIEIVGIQHLLDKYPENTIVVIMNSPIKRKLRYKLKNILEGNFTSWMLNDPMLIKPFVSAEENLKKDFLLIENNPRVILITPSSNSYIPSRTTNPKILKKTWEFGFKKGREITDFLRIGKSFR